MNIFKTSERITASDAIKVRDEIKTKLLQKYPDLILIDIGSVGKKKDGDTHGDIDIAVKCQDFDELASLINNVFPECQQKTMAGSKKKTEIVHSINYPYQSEAMTKYVQCDFMLVHNEEFAKFRYYCPDYRKNESRYKAYARILLLEVILNTCAKHFIKNIGDNTYLSFRAIGLYKNVISTVNSNPIEFVTDDVNTIIHYIFEDNITADDICTPEKLWECLHSESFKYFDELEKIEIRYFVSAYNMPWYELNLDPGDFILWFWPANKIKQKMHEHDFLNDINMKLMKLQKK